MVSVCILQPSYIPWKGYFHQIALSDIFVFFDTVQYDKRGWRNRNKIKTPQGLEWLTIPVNAHGTHQGLLIKDVHIADNNWVEKHLQKIQRCYKQAAYYHQTWPWLETELTQAAQYSTTISQVDQCLTKAIARYIQLNHVQFVLASDLPVQAAEDPTDRLVQICCHLNANTYITGPSAKDYLDQSQFNRHDIQITWMAYDYPTYTQCFDSFSHEVSIIDMLFNLGQQETTSFFAQRSKPPMRIVQ